MYKNSSKRLLLVVGLGALLLGLVVGFSTVSADEPTPAGECLDCECPTGYASCRRSDCPCGASWQDCHCVQLVVGPCVCQCECLCDPCDATVTIGYGGIGSVYATYSGLGASYGRSVLGTARVGFWGNYPERYREYRGWLGFGLGYLPEREVEMATIVLEDVSTQWLSTDENTSIVAELIDLGPSWPGGWWELNWPATRAELLRLTTEEVSEMLQPIQFSVPPALLEERIARAQMSPHRRLIIRLWLEGAPTNNLLDVGSARLYIKWTN